MRLLKLSLLLLLVTCPPHAFIPPAVAGQTQADRPAKTINAKQLRRLMANGGEFVIVDVRTPKDYEASQTKIKGALRIAPGDLEWRLNDLPKKKTVVLYCACPRDQTSHQLAGRLREYGYQEVLVLWGGWGGWVQAAGQQEPK
jgi:rhodanese-related sulfurtransferase